MFFIETERLKLIPLTYHQLLLLQQSRKRMELSLGLQPSAMKIDPLFVDEFNDALQSFWLLNTQQHPDQYQWYTNWEVIHKQNNTSIGGMGFSGYPDENGETMVGYCIDGNQHNKGYGTEALKAITHWASECDDLQTLKIETAADNYASVKIAIKCNFKQISIKDDNLIFEYRV